MNRNILFSQISPRPRGLISVLVGVGALLLPPVAWPENDNPVEPNVVIQWNNAALQGVRDSKLGPPMVSRALAIVHTCIITASDGFRRGQGRGGEWF